MKKKSIKKKNKKKKNMKKINMIFLVIASIVIMIVIIKLFSSKTKIIMINKSVDIEIGGYNQSVMINYITNNISVNDNGYIEVNIDIENKKNIDSNASYHQFYLVDQSGNEVGPCYHGGMINDDLPNIFPNVIKANGHTEGNLYCPTIEDEFKQFKIKVISGGSIGADNKIYYEYQDYFVDLKD